MGKVEWRESEAHPAIRLVSHQEVLCMISMPSG